MREILALDHYQERVDNMVQYTQVRSVRNFTRLGFDVVDVEGFEPASFLEDVASEVIDPMVETQALFERTAVQTRLYTTMSADEMTMDPVFDFNADLPEVSNQHTADRFIECSPAVSRFEAPWRVELASGDVLRGEGGGWPFDLATTDMPASAVIKRVGPTGTGEGNIEEDNREVFCRALATARAGAADGIVTLNLKDFPRRELGPLGLPNTTAFNIWERH